MVVQLMGAGYVFEIATEGAIPYSIGSIILLAVVMFYVSFGGFRAVAWTDTFQGIYMIIALFFAAAVVLGKVGGFGALMTQFQTVLPQNLTMPGGAGLYKPGMWFSFALMAIIGHAICMPYSWVRFNTANSAKTLRIAVLLSPFYLTLLYIPIFIIGMGGRLLIPGLARPDTILPIMLYKYLTPLPAALIITGALAAMKSTVDSYVHIISAMVARDVYPMIKRDSTEKEQIKVGRIVIVIVGIIAYILSQMHLGMLVMVGLIAYSGGAQFFPALFGMIFWKRGTPAGAWSSIILGTAIMLFARFVTNPIPSLDAGTVGLICGSIVYFVVSLLTKPLPVEITEKYHGYLKRAMGK
jgi:SSS family solute:Na+ symporter